MATPLASLLPNGQQQFFDGNGTPLGMGLVYMYEPGTTTLKDTWKDAGETLVNENPIPLDAGGYAIIYGSGQYSQVVRDSAGVLVWNQLTQDLISVMAEVLASGGGYATDTGAVNGLVITLSPPPGDLTSLLGTVLRVLVANTNTGGATLNVNGLGAIAIQNPDGTAVTAGQLVSAGVASVVYDGNVFELQSITGAPVTGLVTPTQLQEQAGNYAQDSGVVNAIIISLNPAPVSFPDLGGVPIRVLVANTNTGNSTLSINGLTATQILGTDGQVMLAGDLQVGTIYEFIYNGSVFILLSERSTVSPPDYGLFGTVSDVTGSRALGIVYTNSTGKPMFVSATFNYPGGGFSTIALDVNGLEVSAMSSTGADFLFGSGMVPPGGNYELVQSGASGGSINSWTEVS